MLAEVSAPDLIKSAGGKTLWLIASNIVRRSPPLPYAQAAIT